MINRPCYVGFTWLSLQLYQKKIDADMLFTDADSLTYEIVDEFVGLKSKMHSIKILTVKNLIKQKE